MIRAGFAYHIRLWDNCKIVNSKKMNFSLTYKLMYAYYMYRLLM